MDGNALCGIDGSTHLPSGLPYGTYTAEGINALCEGLKGSAVTSLTCAAPAKHGMSTSVSSR